MITQLFTTITLLSVLPLLSCAATQSRNDSITSSTALINSAATCIDTKCDAINYSSFFDSEELRDCVRAALNEKGLLKKDSVFQTKLKKVAPQLIFAAPPGCPKVPISVIFDIDDSRVVGIYIGAVLF
jgi:hypothetical protein